MQGGSTTRWTFETMNVLRDRKMQVDPPRAGPGSSNVREQREGEGKVLLAGSTGQFRRRKTAQGQVHKMPHLMFISSFRAIVKMTKGGFCELKFLNGLAIAPAGCMPCSFKQ